MFEGQCYIDQSSRSREENVLLNIVSATLREGFLVIIIIIFYTPGSKDPRG